MNEGWTFIQRLWRLTMTKDDLIGFSLIPFILVGCIYREELANFVGYLLNCLFNFVG